MYKNKQITAWKPLCTGFSRSLVLYQKSHSFAALTRSISDTSPTRVKIPYARAFHEVISILYSNFRVANNLYFFEQTLHKNIIYKLYTLNAL